MYTDIYDDAMWLINLVENLLSVSRLEEGRMNLRLSTELIDEVVAEAMRHINRKSVEYHLHVQNSEEYLLAQIDAKLIVQVLINIIDNAIKYTPPGSDIEIGWSRRGSFIDISIADNGPGIPDDWRCVSLSSMHTGEKFQWPTMCRMEQSSHFQYQPGR